MTDTGKDHGHSVLVAIIDAVFVPDGSSRLDNRADSLRTGDFHAIRKREKGIRSHDRPFQGEVKGFGFLNRLFQCIYPGCLSYSAGEQLPVFY